MAHEVIVPPGSAPPLAPYSPGIKAGNVVHVSGMVALDAAGNLIGPGDIKLQTRAVLNAIKEIVEAAGGTMRDVAFNTVLLGDLKNYAAMNEVYREFFPTEPPARYCIRADLVKPEFLIEIASVAYLS
jgi:aminoacrylate peracid reductase